MVDGHEYDLKRQVNMLSNQHSQIEHLFIIKKKVEHELKDFYKDSVH